MKSTPFVTDKDDKTLFIKLKYSGIHPLVVAYDGISLIFFGKGKTAYLTVEDAANWHEKELRDTRGRSGNQEVLALLRKALADFQEGRCVPV